MTYKIIVTRQARIQLDRCIHYISKDLRNPVDAKNVLNDFLRTMSSLTQIAGSLPYLLDEELASAGYKKLQFEKHRYLLIFRIVDDSVVIEAVYHTLQDYENLLK